VSQPLSIEVEGHQCSAVFSAVGNTTLPFLQTVSSVWYLIHRTALCGMYNLTRREGLFKGRRPPQIHHITISSPDHPHSSFTQNTSIHPIYFFLHHHHHLLPDGGEGRDKYKCKYFWFLVWGQASKREAMSASEQGEQIQPVPFIPDR
jgi:hypothetical protein